VLDVSGVARLLSPARLLGLVSGPAEAAIARLAPAGSAPRAQSHVLRVRGHRPWPVPDSPWLQGQTWRELLFAHWAISEHELRRAVPDVLPIDTFEGQAWIAVTPFEVTGLRLRGTLPAPALSRFAEINVRTYTSIDGRPGIYFLSLDAASGAAVAAARASYRLPYFRARMAIERSAQEIRYRSTRVDDGARLRLRYWPTGEAFHAEPGTLEHFLTERYCLYTVVDGSVRRAEIHHPPWPLQPAQATIDENTMTEPAGIRLPAREPLLHYAARQDVVIWALT
jgi:uncharacterized protein YqjF (DUF2071 family)